MMWCNKCELAVREPIEVKLDEIPDKNLGEHRTIIIQTCPRCGSELYETASECIVCGDTIPPGESFCRDCLLVIDLAFRQLAKELHVSEDDVEFIVDEYLRWYS